MQQIVNHLTAICVVYDLLLVKISFGSYFELRAKKKKKKNKSLKMLTFLKQLNSMLSCFRCQLIQIQKRELFKYITRKREESEFPCYRQALWKSRNSRQARTCKWNSELQSSHTSHKLHDGTVLCSQSLSDVLHFSSMDCSLPDSSVHGILLARILEWVAISCSKMMGTRR